MKNPTTFFCRSSSRWRSVPGSIPTKLLISWLLTTSWHQKYVLIILPAGSKNATWLLPAGSKNAKCILIIYYQLAAKCILIILPAGTKNACRLLPVANFVLTSWIEKYGYLGIASWPFYTTCQLAIKWLVCLRIAGQFFFLLPASWSYYEADQLCQPFKNCANLDAECELGARVDDF